MTVRCPVKCEKKTVATICHFVGDDNGGEAASNKKSLQRNDEKPAIKYMWKAI